MTCLTLEALHKEYDQGHVAAIGGLPLDVEGGGFTTVVGPPGYERSTTLRMVAGLKSLSDNTIRIGSEDVTDQHTHKCNVTVVLQNCALHPRKTVMQNIAFGLWVSADLLRGKHHECAREAAAMMGIEGPLGDKPDELSDGWKQRIALGRTIVRKPDVFLFDEPLSSLGARLRAAMQIGTQRLQSKLGVTSLYITHDQEEATMMGDEIVTLNDRKPQQVGRPKDMYENPANKLVDGFTDSPSMNFPDVSTEREGDRLVLTGNSSFSYHLSGSFSAALHEATDATDLRVDVRPEDVVTVSSDKDIVDSTVGVAEPIGSDNYPRLGIGPDFTARINLGIEPKTGETTGVTFDESNLHVSHPRTGESFLFRESKRRAASTQQT